MQFVDVENPSKMEDGHTCASCPHDVEEVQSTPYVEELKEEDKRVQDNTLIIQKEYETIFVSQSRDETNGEHEYAYYYMQILMKIRLQPLKDTTKVLGPRS